MLPESDIKSRGSDRIVPRHRHGNLELEIRGDGFGDQKLAVEQAHAPALPRDDERPIERRRLAERHLNRIGLDEAREQAADVAAVPGLGRAAEPPGDDDGRIAHA